MSNHNNDYIILQNKNFKVPLLSRNGVWNFEINKVKWGLPDCMERLYAYLIIGENDFKSVAGTLRANNKHISALEICFNILKICNMIHTYVSAKSLQQHLHLSPTLQAPLYLFMWSKQLSQQPGPDIKLFLLA